MLFARLIDAEALEVDVPPRAKLRLHGTRDVDGTLHVQLLHSVLHDAKLERNYTRHFNGATEGNLTVALAKVQVADAELGPGHMDGQEDLGAARQVLDVAVAPVLGTTGNGARAFLADLGLELVRGIAGVDVGGLWRLGDGAVQVAVGGDEFGFALVPGFEDFCGRCAAEDCLAI